MSQTQSPEKDIEEEFLNSIVWYGAGTRNLVIAGPNGQPDGYGNILDVYASILEKYKIPHKRVEGVVPPAEIPSKVEDDGKSFLVYLIQTDDSLAQELMANGHTVPPYFEDFDSVEGVLRIVTPGFAGVGRYILQYHRKYIGLFTTATSSPTSSER